MILQADPRSGAGYGGILLLCLIIWGIYSVIKLIRKTPHKHPISKYLSNEEKTVKNNLYRADNNVKLCKLNNLEIEAFHIDDRINNKTREVSDLNGFINSIITKIKNGYDDIATLTPDIEGIPFQIKEWIQISGPLFYGGAKNDDIYVCICLDSCNSDSLEIYQRLGYRKEGDNAGITKYYKWSEADKIADEVEKIVVTLVGESKANRFVSDDVFSEICKRQMTDAKKTVQRQKKNELIIYIGIAILTPILLFLLAWIFPFIVGMIKYGEGIPGDNLGDYFDNRILVRHNGKRGYIDRLGREVIPIRYDAIDYFSDYNQMIVCENDKWGLLDYEGDVIIPIVYDKTVLFLNQNYCVAIKDGKAGVIDKHNNEIVSFAHNPEALHCYEELGIIVCNRQGRVGAFNFNKEIIIPFVYSRIGDFNNIGKAIAIKNGRYGIIDNKGNVVVDFLYDEMGDYGQCDIGDDRLIAMRKKNRWGFIDNSGNEIISPLYEEVKGFWGDWAPVKKNGKWGFIDERGNIIVDLIYDDLYSYSEHSATVSKASNQIEIQRP